MSGFIYDIRKGYEQKGFFAIWQSFVRNMRRVRSKGAFLFHKLERYLIGLLVLTGRPKLLLLTPSVTKINHIGEYCCWTIVITDLSHGLFEVEFYIHEWLMWYHEREDTSEWMISYQSRVSGSTLWLAECLPLLKADSEVMQGKLKGLGAKGLPNLYWFYNINNI